MAGAFLRLGLRCWQLGAVILMAMTDFEAILQEIAEAARWAALSGNTKAGDELQSLLDDLAKARLNTPESAYGAK